MKLHELRKGDVFQFHPNGAHFIVRAMSRNLQLIEPIPKTYKPTDDQLNSEVEIIL